MVLVAGSPTGGREIAASIAGKPRREGIEAKVAEVAATSRREAAPET